ncbi:MAG TPA: ABC transporter permease [Thermoleophilaceae bacterium]|jgi:ABC-2 type transport system permease protein
MTSISATAPRLAARQVRYELRSFIRNRRRAMLSFAFPLMFLLIFGSLGRDQTISSRGDISFIDFYVPGILTYAILVTTFNSMAMTVSGLRARGVLKRIRTTPLPWSAYVSGLVGATLAAMLAIAALVLLVGIAMLGVDLRLSALPGLVVFIALGSVCLTALGIWAARFIPNPESGMPILMIVTLPLMFVSNVFFPIDDAPTWLKDVAGAFPLKPLADGLATAFDPRSTGVGLVGHDLLVLALWTIAGTVLMLGFLRSLTRSE